MKKGGRGKGRIERGKMYDFKRVGDDADGHQLFAVIATVHHEGVCESFDNWALGFAEALDGISACGVGDVDGRADLDVIAVFDEDSISFCTRTKPKFGG